MSSRVGIQQFVSPTEPTGTQVGDEWFNSATSVLYKRTFNGGVLGWVVLGTSNTTGTAGQVIGITSAGTPGFITVGAASPTATGLVYACMSTSCLGHTALGYCAVGSPSAGCLNIAIGYGALKSNCCACTNVAIGPQAMYCAVNASCTVAIGNCASWKGCSSWSVAIGASALTNANTNHHVAIGAGTLTAMCYSCANTAVGTYAGCSMTCGCHNVAVGYQAMMSISGNCNVAIGYGALYQVTNVNNTIAVGMMSLRNSTTGCNVGIGVCSGCSITSGLGNVILGSYPSCAAAACTVVVQAGNCVRLYIDDSGLLVNGAAVGGAGGGGGSGLFNTSISNQIGYSVTDKLFDPTGTSGFTTMTNYIVMGSTATVGVAAIMPSTTSTRYIVHSIHVTNTAPSDAEITGRIDHTQGWGGTATIQGSLIDHVSFFASRLPVPSGSAVELLKKPQVLYPNDWIRLQATTPQGGTGVNGALTAYIVYESSTDSYYSSGGYNLASTSPTTIFTSAYSTSSSVVTATNFPSILESVRVTNISNVADYRVTVSWTNSLGVVQSYLAYNMLIPAFSTVELLEKPKRIAGGDLIRATPEAANVLSIQVSGKLISSTYV